MLNGALLELFSQDGRLSKCAYKRHALRPDSNALANDIYPSDLGHFSRADL